MKFLDDLGEAIDDFGEAMSDAVEAARKRRMDEARAIAEPLGLQVDDSYRLVGLVNKVPVKRYSRDHGSDNRKSWYTHTEFQLGAPVPAMMVARSMNLFDSLGEWLGTEDIAVDERIDDALWIRAVKGREGTARQLLTLPGVMEPLMALAADKVYLRIAHNQLETQHHGYHLRLGDRGLREGAALAAALNRATFVPWAALAEAPGMARHPTEPWCVQGHLDGVPLRVQIVDEGTGKTFVTAWIEPPFPEGMHITRGRRPAHADGFDDGILDQMLRLRGTSELEAVRRRVCRDDVRGPLLEVVHGHPGSEVRHDRVELVLLGWVGVDLRRYVDLVLELARVLAAE